MNLSTLAKKISKLKKKSEHDPLSYFYPTAPQRAFLNDESKVKMLLGGNQTGKTACACALLLYHCLNRHPTQKTDPAPIEAVLVTHSHSQSVIIQGKLYSMIPKDTLHPDCEYVHGKGFRGVQKVVRFTNGSIIRIKTANQGVGGGLASATCSLVVIDEPVPMDVFNECLARTLRGGFQGSRGILAITMTPVGAVDVSYLEEMMKQGKISVTRARLTVKDTTPIGLSPLLTEQQITSITNQFLPIDREARINGSFHVAPLGLCLLTSIRKGTLQAAQFPQRAIIALLWASTTDRRSALKWLFLFVSILGIHYSQESMFSMNTQQEKQPLKN